MKFKLYLRVHLFVLFLLGSLLGNQSLFAASYTITTVEAKLPVEPSKKVAKKSKKKVVKCKRYRKFRKRVHQKKTTIDFSKTLFWTTFGLVLVGIGILGIIPGLILKLLWLWIPAASLIFIGGLIILLAILQAFYFY